METQPTLSLTDVVAHIAGDVAQAVSERPGESRQRQNERADAAMQAITAFQPGDVVEAMIASHCVMLHELIVADIQRTLRDEEPTTQRATRSRIVAMDRAFGNNLIHLRQYRTARQSETPTAEAGTTTDAADRIRHHQVRDEPENQDAATTAADLTQPGDADALTEAWSNLAQMAGLNRQARRALDRQTRKRALGFPRSGVTSDRNAAATTASATMAG
jgi:hypothetical protein